MKGPLQKIPSSLRGPQRIAINPRVTGGLAGACETRGTACGDGKPPQSVCVFTVGGAELSAGPRSLQGAMHIPGRHVTPSPPPRPTHTLQRTGPPAQPVPAFTNRQSRRQGYLMVGWPLSHWCLGEIGMTPIKPYLFLLLVSHPAVDTQSRLRSVCFRSAAVDGSERRSF